MNIRILLTLAAVALIGCSEDDVTTTPTETGVAEDTGSATETSTTETGGEETATDASVEETAPDVSMTDAPGDARVDGDSAPAARIKCGATSCNPDTDLCCGTGGTASCVAKSGACTNSRFECSDSDTCGAGQRCCGVIGTVSGSQCRASCTSLEIELCDSNDECTGGDGGDAGRTCKPITGSGAMTGYSRCE